MATSSAVIPPFRPPGISTLIVVSDMFLEHRGGTFRDGIHEVAGQQKLGELRPTWVGTNPARGAFAAVTWSAAKGTPMTFNSKIWMFCGCLGLMACSRQKADPGPSAKEPHSPNTPPGSAVGRVAEAELDEAPGQDVDGDLKFETAPDGVRISGSIEASPGVHGFHIHEKGDCSDIAGKSMGAHFAPDGHEHALPTEGANRHLGDLGNVVIEADGKAKLDFVIIGANLTASDAHSLLGRSIVLHASKDVGKAEQPAGDSGTPIACGVIKLDS